MESEDFLVSANMMTIYIDEDYADIEGNISGVRAGRVTTNMELDERERKLREKNTYLSADFMKYTTVDDNDVMEMTGNVRVWQEDKSIEAEKALYNKKKDYYMMEGIVQFRSHNLKWLIDSKKKKTFSNEDVSKSIASAVTVYSDLLTFDAQKKELKLLGNISITQEDKIARCHKLTYHDESGLLTLIGDVSVIKDKEDTFKCDTLIINVNKEEFYASREIQTEFKVKKKRGK